MKRIVSIFSLLILLVGIYQYTKILGVYVIPKEATQENIVEQPSYNREWDEENTEIIKFPSGEYATQEEIVRIGQLHKLKQLEIKIAEEEIDLTPLGNLTELKTLRIEILSEGNVDLCANLRKGSKWEKADI